MELCSLINTSCGFKVDYVREKQVTSFVYTGAPEGRLMDEAVVKLSKMKEYSNPGIDGEFLSCGTEHIEVTVEIPVKDARLEGVDREVLAAEVWIGAFKLANAF